MDEDEVVVRVIVRGRVQGVGYRAFTETEALARGVRGWVRNLRTGEVEAIFAGDASAVETLCAICREGPPHALVLAVDILPADRGLLEDSGWEGGFHQLATL
ncbi:MAG: acylphosphatase [Methylovirgula sp.]|jgi:acylphosphatase